MKPTDGPESPASEPTLIIAYQGSVRGLREHLLPRVRRMARLHVNPTSPVVARQTRKAVAKDMLEQLKSGKGRVA